MAFNIIQKNTGMQLVSKQSKVRVFAFSARSIAESNGNNFKRYYGFGKFKCVAVNPNAAQLAKMLGRDEIGQEPNYQSEIITGNVSWPQVRLDFWMQSTTDVNMLVKLSYYLTKGPQYNGDKTKVHVIDEFGRTAWVTIDECENHQIPMYKNGPANITNNYTPMAGKEHEYLVGFLKSLLWISPYQFVDQTGKVVTNDPEKCKCRLDKISDYFKNDFSELQSAIQQHPENEVWALVGVQKADDGNLYQKIFKEAIVSIRNKNFKNVINKALDERKSAGAYANVDFDNNVLHEYEVEETDFNEKPQQAPEPKNIDNFFK